MVALLYLLFFCSGISGLVYQVVWVRAFGNVFGNTSYSASLVVAVFMLGLGTGSYLFGAWADRRYAARPTSLLRAYAWTEVAIAVLSLLVSLGLPHLEGVSARVSAYAIDTSGWHVLTTASLVARAALVVLLILPASLLMGGTLTLLVRHLVRHEPTAQNWRIALLYGVNTAGAALGCLLTDFVLVPAFGLQGTQVTAVVLNFAAAAGAFLISSRESIAALPEGQPATRRGVARRRGAVTSVDDASGSGAGAGAALAWTSLALILSGFAAMGMEILWFRHFTIMLGGFRAVFSLLLAVILSGTGTGALAAGVLVRRAAVRGGGDAAAPARWLMLVQTAVVAAMLAGLAQTDGRRLDAIAAADPAYAAAAGVASEPVAADSSRTLAEIWFNARPILWEVALPALLMGLAFPLANAVVQQQERHVGRRAGLLYLANTTGAVAGSLLAGFVLLPMLGLQGSATFLALAGVCAVIPLHLAGRLTGASAESPRHSRGALLASLVVGGGALAGWLLLPADFVITRALPAPVERERTLDRTEGISEVVTVVDRPGRGRTLFTNGHPMSSTAIFSQRYMRALAHLPLLSMPHPASVLVIGFGVGNTTHAATLHPSVRRVDVADLSRNILSHAPFFRDVNHDVLRDPRVSVFLNDGRHHLRMQPPGSYDLITLEPPPIAYAGVAALYSREFYVLARSRLSPAGYLSQWLPAYQVPTATTLSMIRAFLDVFPKAVLLSGAHAELLLLGTTGDRLEIEPASLRAALAAAPAVAADLRRLDLGTVREIAGSFVGSAERMEAATRGVEPVTDDRPLQEYSVRSLLNLGEAVPSAVVDLSGLPAWCPGCFVGGRPAPLADGLDVYLRLLGLAYAAAPQESVRARQLFETEGRTIAGSAYLGSSVPESAETHNVLGLTLAGGGRLADAVEEFRVSLRIEPDSASSHWHLGAALAALGAGTEALGYMERAVALDPSNGNARVDLAALLLGAGRIDDAVMQARTAVAALPESAEAQQALGVALASQGHVEEALPHLRQALVLDPGLPDARRLLALAERRLGAR